MDSEGDAGDHAGGRGPHLPPGGRAGGTACRSQGTSLRPQLRPGSSRLSQRCRGGNKSRSKISQFRGPRTNCCVAPNRHRSHPCCRPCSYHSLRHPGRHPRPVTSTRWSTTCQRAKGSRYSSRSSRWRRKSSRSQMIWLRFGSGWRGQFSPWTPRWMWGGFARGTSSRLLPSSWGLGGGSTSARRGSPRG